MDASSIAHRWKYDVFVIDAETIAQKSISAREMICTYFKMIGTLNFGSDTAIKEGELVKRTGSIVDVPTGKAYYFMLLGVLSRRTLGRLLMEDGANSKRSTSKKTLSKWKASWVIERKVVQRSLCKLGYKSGR
ncbi:hypothetical protein Tco_0371267 [Tanacetum coccineum]